MPKQDSVKSQGASHVIAVKPRPDTASTTLFNFSALDDATPATPQTTARRTSRWVDAGQLAGSAVTFVDPKRSDLQSPTATFSSDLLIEIQLLENSQNARDQNTQAHGDALQQLIEAAAAKSKAKAASSKPSKLTPPASAAPKPASVSPKVKKPDTATATSLHPKTASGGKTDTFGSAVPKINITKSASAASTGSTDLMTRRLSASAAEHDIDNLPLNLTSRNVREQVRLARRKASFVSAGQAIASAAAASANPVVETDVSITDMIIAVDLPQASTPMTTGVDKSALPSSGGSGASSFGFGF